MGQMDSNGPISPIFKLPNNARKAENGKNIQYSIEGRRGRFRKSTLEGRP